MTILEGTVLTGSLRNSGTINVQSSDLTVNLADPGATAVNSGTLTIGSLQAFILEGGDFANTGTVTLGNFGSVVVTGNYIQTAGLTNLSDGILTAGGLVDLEGGVLSGTGVINASVLNNAELDVGQPGSPGVLTIVGDYTQTSGGVLVMEIGARNPRGVDQLDVTGQATLDGTLTVNLIDGFMPNTGNIFLLLAFASGTGTFATIDGDGGLFTPSYDTTGVTLVAN